MLGTQDDIVQHRRALTHRDAAVAVEAMWTLGVGAGGPMFPIRSGRETSRLTLHKMIQHLGIAAVAHGFRSPFLDWATEETDHPREVIEVSLAHVVPNKVKAAYARSDLFARRQQLMDDRGNYLIC